jgi:uncharacterized protein YqjF (DUF2071 family)
MSLCGRLPWLVSQTEAEMLFLSWPVPAAAVAGRIPPRLSLDTYEQQAWITLIPFRMERLHLRGLPPAPPFSRFDEVDCLTYVMHREERGIWFFRIDAASLVGSMVGRRLFGLPYHHSTVSLDLEGEERIFQSAARGNAGDERPELRVRYRPRGPAHVAAPGTLAHFIVERFVMFSSGGSGTLLRGLEARAPRKIQECDVTVSRNTLPQAAGIPGPTGEPIAWYCGRSEIRTWLPAPLGEPVTSRGR